LVDGPPPALTDAGAATPPDAAPATDTSSSTDTSSLTDAPSPADTAVCLPAQCTTSQPCQQAACVDGTCVVTALADGSPCDEGDPCSPSDTCKAGQCTAGADACHPPFAQAIGQSPCHFDWSPPPTDALTLTPWFAQAGLQQPIHLAAFPGLADRVAVVQRPGQIVVLDNQANAGPGTVLLDIAAKVSTAGEGGLLSVAFHPQFHLHRKLYVHYTSTGKFTSRISSFEVLPGEPPKADPASEQVLLTIEQPFTNHNGGQVAFDAQGMLLIGMGDGGAAGDPLGAGQNGMMLLGKMLRIDVDHPAGGKPYGIPADNPFVGKPGVLPEVFALGLRNPWRFSVDPANGGIWAGDVGQGLWEEIDLIAAGHNYGWNTMEGNHCYPSGSTCSSAGLTPPIVELPHGQANSITGGHVYRGKLHPGLFGSYVFADYVTGKFWATKPDGTGAWTTQLLLSANFKPVSFGVDRHGELYVLQIFPAAVRRVDVAPPQNGAPPAPPPTLAQTGCFTSLQPLTPAPGLLPYELNAPLWSDGAHKQRWLVLPPGAKPTPGGTGPLQVAADAHGHWDVPPGTLVWKHFALGDGQTPAETRLMRRTTAGWDMFSFRWLADGSDAVLGAGGDSQVLPVTQGQTSTTQVWHYPTQAQCRQCHQGPTAAYQLLGPSQAQLDRPTAALAGQNQLEAWRLAGLLSLPVAATQVTALPDLTALEQGGSVDKSQLGAAARAWLHVQCAHCHAPGLLGQAKLDLRFGTPLGQTQACAQPPQLGDVGVAGAQLLAPGQPDASVIWLRLAQAAGSPWQMPPVGVSLPHAAGVQLVKDWIAGLGACP
jgi:uncharacterized repeat protein (TIGR03806 family)